MNNNDGNFIDNTIYCCFAEDALEYADEIGIDMEVVISLYFPLLIKQEVLDKDTLIQKREKLIKKTKQMASTYLFDIYNRVDLFYNIYNTRTTELSYASKGISVFAIILHPDIKHLLPLDIIFKNIHSTKTIPFIKYNPGFRRENIYRFYSEEITKYGTKIPFLPAKTILKLAKETGKKKQISFSVENENGDFYIDIQSTGDIRISGNNFREPMTIDRLNSVIQTVANPVIHHINDFLRKNGYEVKDFQDIREKEIEIEYLRYIIAMKISKEIDIVKYTDCLQPIFDIDTGDIHSGLSMRFKRVENYSEMDEETIFITSLFGKKTDKEVVDMISKKYDISFTEATVKFSNFIKDHERIMQRQMTSKIVDSPGFLMTMAIQSYEDLFVCEIEMDNATIHVHINYIDVIQMYVDSLLRISQDLKSCAVSTNMISRICKPTVSSPKSIERFDNIVMGIEASDIMFSDVYEEDIDEDVIEGDVIESTAFGDLKQYESADIREDIEDIQKYEGIEDLSPIDEDSESNSKSSDLMMAPDESSESNSKSSDLIMAPDESSESKSSDLMMAPDESSESKSSDLMMAPDESSESNEERKKEIEKGGSKDGSQMKKDVTGMFLKDNNNNLFLSKMKRIEPTLFLSEDDGKFNAYSKLCQASRQRQPIILTQEEKDKIDENDTKNKSKSYNHALEYGSDPNKKNWYICPRFWCLKTNASISEADVKAGKCGKIIPKGAKTVPEGHAVYEFNHTIQHHARDGSYKENTPGFLEGSLHPKGLCLPCCFKKEWDSKTQMDRRSECNLETKTDKKEKRPKNAKQEEYVYEIRRYPIPPRRWGFLPMAVQLFLQTDYSLVVNPDNNKYLKEDESTSTLLRYGVENSPNKSFVACMADIYAYKKKIATVPTIEEMCNIISTAVTIDLFIQYHNGSLLSIFKPKTYTVDEIDPTKYEGSVFMSKLNMANDTHLEFINDTIATYENFQDFLKNKESYVNHTYLWDIVCTPNPNLFQSGCNLAILKIREVDITDDIELLCPTSVYSSELYDMRKETVILLKHDEYYEPIYLFRYQIGNVDNKQKKELIIKKTFLEDKSIDNVKEVLQIIRNSIKKYCAPQSSIPRIYKFKKAIPAESLRIILLKYNFEIKNQILNYQGKTIGFWIRAKEDGIFLPCYPSSQLPDIPILFMDDDTLWNDYITTKNRLKKIYTISNGEIPCRPKLKIMEDGLIIGILTETNQFIMLATPTENIENDNIPAIKDENYIIADKVMSQTKKEDELRVNTIKMISLETQFYSAFRATVRNLIHQSKNKPYKQQITEIIQNSKYLYKSKLEVVERIIRKISSQAIGFQTFDEATLLSFDEITDCFSNPTDKKYCVIQTSGDYQMILPQTHLISGLNNSQIYFSRVADELIRYKRIQMFIMDTQMYLNITNTEYKINVDEMIMLESLLTSDYFKSIEPYEHGKMTKITYETANPILTQKYTNEVTLESQQQMVISDNTKDKMQDTFGIECIQSVIPIIGNSNSEWKLFFPKTASEMYLNTSVKCSYYPFIYIYNAIYNIQMTVEQVKSKLAAEYEMYMDKYQNKILNILRKQGKKDLIDNIVRGKYTLQTAIASEVYFLTNLDLWILSTKFSLPIILFHQKQLKHLINTVNWLKLSDPPAGKPNVYYFIRVPTETAIAGNYLPQYNIVKPSFKHNSKEMIQLFSKMKPSSNIKIDAFFDKIENKE